MLRNLIFLKNSSVFKVIADMIRYSVLFVICLLILFLAIGFLFSLFHMEPRLDPVEQALEEVTGKRNRKKK